MNNSIITKQDRNYTKNKQPVFGAKALIPGYAADTLKQFLPNKIKIIRGSVKNSLVLSGKDALEFDNFVRKSGKQTAKNISSAEQEYISATAKTQAHSTLDGLFEMLKKEHPELSSYLNIVIFNVTDSLKAIINHFNKNTGCKSYQKEAPALKAFIGD